MGYRRGNTSCAQALPRSSSSLTETLFQLSLSPPNLCLSDLLAHVYIRLSLTAAVKTGRLSECYYRRPQSCCLQHTIRSSPYVSAHPQDDVLRFRGARNYPMVGFCIEEDALGLLDCMPAGGTRSRAGGHWSKSGEWFIIELHLPLVPERPVCTYSQGRCELLPFFALELMEFGWCRSRGRNSSEDSRYSTRARWCVISCLTRSHTRPPCLLGAP